MKMRGKYTSCQKEGTNYKGENEQGERSRKQKEKENNQVNN